MANDRSESKTEAPTPRRLRQAREEGHVPKSTELAAALSLLCTLLCIIAMSPWAARLIADFQLAVDRSFEAISPTAVEAMSIEAAWLLIRLSLPPVGLAALIYLLVLWLQIGTVFSIDSVIPKLERLNPIDGLQRVFSTRSLVLFSLTLLKATVVTGAAILVLLHQLGDAVRVIYADAGAALTVANAALVQLMLWCGGVFVALALLDLVYQRWQYLRDLRMSVSDLKREHRDDHGDGQLKSLRRGFARQASPRELLASIPAATLVISDGHERVAVLVYRPKHHPLPFCVVRGKGSFANEVQDVANQHKILTVVDSSLIERLYPVAHSGLPIPGALFEAMRVHLLHVPAV